MKTNGFRFHAIYFIISIFYLHVDIIIILIALSRRNYITGCRNSVELTAELATTLSLKFKF